MIPEKKVAIVIPARYKSSRFPGKPLAVILGKPMIIWVAELCSRAIDKSYVYVATDDQRIKSKVEQYGFNCILTSSDHLTGTDRIAEFSTLVDAEIYINVQGDEPIIDYKDIQKVIQKKIEHPNDIINGYCRIGPKEDPSNVNIPKVLFTEDKRMVYMSRKSLPGFKESTNAPTEFFKQVCIYAFDKEQLKKYKEFGRKSSIEAAEDIEILRFLEFGETIRMIETAGGSLAVDIPEDIKLVEAEMILRNAEL